MPTVLWIIPAKPPRLFAEGGGSLERRLVAILAADVVGYARLMGADETGTLGRLKAHRKEPVEPQIAAHRGRIVKLMGDGVLVEFDSVVNAVACAAAIQRGMAERNAAEPAARRIELRIGVNLGDVIVEGEDIYGDGVNIAARIEAFAEPGGICVTATVHHNVKAKLDLEFDDLGEQQFKNIAEPVRVFRARVPGAAIPPSRAVEPPQRPDKPTIAVLPFTNMSGDPDQEYFSDGITEDVITELSRFHEFAVIARNSSFRYKGKSPRIEDVGRDLGAKFVVEGSVRKIGNRVRVTVQLIDSTT